MASVIAVELQSRKTLQKSRMEKLFFSGTSDPHHVNLDQSTNLLPQPFTIQRRKRRRKKMMKETMVVTVKRKMMMMYERVVPVPVLCMGFEQSKKRIHTVELSNYNYHHLMHQQLTSYCVDDL